MDKHDPSSNSFHADTRDLGVVVIIKRFHPTIQPLTVVQEPAGRLLCTRGERGKLISCQLIVVGVPAATLIHDL
jgi:hypothetical protein